MGDNSVIGHTTEVIRSIILNKVRADHFAYIGDSILRNRCHLGAGVILANLKMRTNPSSVEIRIDGRIYDTGVRKLGTILGSDAEIGCDSMANPGTIFGKNVTTYTAIVLRECHPFVPAIEPPIYPHVSRTTGQYGMEERGHCKGITIDCYG